MCSLEHVTTHNNKYILMFKTKTPEVYSTKNHSKFRKFNLCFIFFSKVLDRLYKKKGEERIKTLRKHLIDVMCIYDLRKCIKQMKRSIF